MAKKLKIKMGAGKVSGTSAQGYMPDGVTYQQLVDVFGCPNGDVDQDTKIDCEWYGTIDDDASDRTFTIYNYKTGRSYLGDAGKEIEHLVGKEWHIGGNLPYVAELVVQYFKTHSKTS